MKNAHLDPKVSNSTSESVNVAKESGVQLDMESRIYPSREGPALKGPLRASSPEFKRKHSHHETPAEAPGM